MKIITLLCTCMGYLSITSAMERPGEGGPSKEFILPGQAQTLPHFRIDPQRSSALGGPGKLFILRGHEVQIQIPGGHTLTGRLEHGDRPSWIRNPQEPAISNNVFVDMPPPYGKSFVANVVDRAPNSPEDPNFKHFEAFIIGSGKKSYKAQLHPQSGRNPVHPTIFVRHPGTKTNYEGQLLPA